MDDLTASGYARSGARATSTTLLGQVMSLVAIALGFLTAGALIGRDLSQGTALILFFAGFGMLLVQSFGGERLRVRQHGTERDAVWLATGIFVSIVNIFLSLLNLFDN